VRFARLGAELAGVRDNLRDSAISTTSMSPRGNDLKRSRQFGEAVGRVTAHREGEGAEKDTKLLELSANGTTSLELFAINFVPDGHGNRSVPIVYWSQNYLHRREFILVTSMDQNLASRLASRNSAMASL
jgi:hypothetical protein